MALLVDMETQVHPLGATAVQVPRPRAPRAGRISHVRSPLLAHSWPAVIPMLAG